MSKKLVFIFFLIASPALRADPETSPEGVPKTDCLEDFGNGPTKSLEPKGQKSLTSDPFIDDGIEREVVQQDTE